MKMVGKTTSKATNTMKRVKSTAARRPMSNAAMRENRKTVMEKVMKRKRGKPVRTICAVRKACIGLLVLWKNRNYLQDSSR